MARRATLSAIQVGAKIIIRDLSTFCLSLKLPPARSEAKSTEHVAVAAWQPYLSQPLASPLDMLSFCRALHG